MINVLESLNGVESALSDMEEMDTVVLAQQYAVFRSAATYLLETGRIEAGRLQLQQAMDAIALDMARQQYEEAILLLLMTVHQLRFSVTQLVAEE